MSHQPTPKKNPIRFGKIAITIDGIIFVNVLSLDFIGVVLLLADTAGGSTGITMVRIGLAVLDIILLAATILYALAIKYLLENRISFPRYFVWALIIHAIGFLSFILESVTLFTPSHLEILPSEYLIVITTICGIAAWIIRSKFPRRVV